MFNDEKLIKEIIDIVSKERMILETQSGLGMCDDNKNWEVVICHLLNMVYGYELINLNDEKLNYPGIDLGDKKRGLGVQVTSTKKSSKIGESLRKVYENRVYEMYPKFKIFILGKKQKKYSVDTESYKEKISFDIKADVLDFDDLLREIKQIDVERKEEILEYLKKMFVDKRQAEVENISKEREGIIEKKRS